MIPQPPPLTLERAEVDVEPEATLLLCPLQPTIADFLNLAWWTSAAAW